MVSGQGSEGRVTFTPLLRRLQYKHSAHYCPLVSSSSLQEVKETSWYQRHFGSSGSFEIETKHVLEVKHLYKYIHKKITIVQKYSNLVKNKMLKNKQRIKIIHIVREIIVKSLVKLQLRMINIFLEENSEPDYPRFVTFDLK